MNIKRRKFKYAIVQRPFSVSPSAIAAAEKIIGPTVVTIMSNATPPSKDAKPSA